MKIATKTQRHKVTLKDLYINEFFVPSCLCGNHFHASPGEAEASWVTAYKKNKEDKT